MNPPFADAVPETVRYYLDRIAHVLEMLSREPDPQRFLAIRLAPDSLETAVNFAIAIRFAARVLCPPAGREPPDLPDVYTCESLLSYKAAIDRIIAPIAASDLRHPVSHIAGLAQIEQEPADYITRFALPNMIFHFTMAYAGLRHGGMRIGKADFDGQHRY